MQGVRKQHVATLAAVEARSSLAAAVIGQVARDKQSSRSVSCDIVEKTSADVRTAVHARPYVGKRCGAVIYLGQALAWRRFCTMIH